MKIISKLQKNSTVKNNFKLGHEQALDNVKAAVIYAAAGGGKEARERHLKKGKMLPRERVSNLLDSGSPFLEIGATAAFNMYDNEVSCAGIITGIGKVHGHYVMVVCNDATVKGLSLIHI